MNENSNIINQSKLIWLICWVELEIEWFIDLVEVFKDIEENQVEEVSKKFIEVYQGLIEEWKGKGKKFESLRSELIESSIESKLIWNWFGKKD